MQHVLEEPIPIQIYQQMRVDGGLSPKSDESAKIGLENSIHSVQITDKDSVIGMGRIIGDGGCFCQVVDICVHPEHQGKGIGKLIMQKIKAMPCHLKVTISQSISRIKCQ